MGGAKPTTMLLGRPLVEYPVRALRAELPEVVILAKPETALPSIPAISVWAEPSLRHHPAVGIAHALGRAGGRWVLACAGDMPLVSAELLEVLLETDPQSAPVVVPRCAGRLEPLLALYGPGARSALEVDSDRPLREIVAGLQPRVVDVDDPTPFFNVNRPEDLREAAALMATRK